MKTLSLSGSKRELLGRSALNSLRGEGYIPCELYGKSGNLHFSIFVSDLKPLVYSPDTFKVNLSIDGEAYEAVVKQIQFHPLSEEILHIDFFEVSDDQVIKIELPINFIGTAAGAREGGKFVKKIRKLKVKGTPANMPETIDVDISHLALGKSIKVKEVIVSNIEILNAMATPIASVEIPRGLRGKTEEADGKKK